MLVDSDVHVAAHTGRNILRWILYGNTDRNALDTTTEGSPTSIGTAGYRPARRDAANMPDLTVEIAEGIGVEIDQHFLADPHVTNLTFVHMCLDPIELRVVQHKYINAVFYVFAFIFMYFSNHSIDWALYLSMFYK